MAVGLLHAVENLTNGGAVEVGGPLGRHLGRGPLDDTPEFQIVEGSLSVALDQQFQRLGERAQELGHPRALTVGDDQASLLQVSQGVAQGRPRHVELLRQLAFRQQPLARP